MRRARPRSPRPTALVAVITAAFALLLPGVALAHSLYVAPPGSLQLDLGTGQQSRLVHATLLGSGDTIDAQLSTDGGIAQDVTLLVPASLPEGDAARRDLPRAERRVGDRVEPVQRIDETRRWTDRTTGVAYRAIGRLRIGRTRGDAQPRVTSTIHVERGATPTRVALLVEVGNHPFRAEDVRATPRALLGVRAWAESPAAGARHVPSRDGHDRGLQRFVWIPVSLGGLAVALAAWWISAGWRRSRERGARQR
ncbi:MAG: hypothetical protein JWM98_1089 [Thermoleophilia bacterium]|nr:hypothetical protein [Thermoleophilia bacterium]